MTRAASAATFAILLAASSTGQKDREGRLADGGRVLLSDGVEELHPGLGEVVRRAREEEKECHRSRSEAHEFSLSETYVYLTVFDRTSFFPS